MLGGKIWPAVGGAALATAVLAWAGLINPAVKPDTTLTCQAEYSAALNRIISERFADLAAAEARAGRGVQAILKLQTMAERETEEEEVPQGPVSASGGTM